MASSPDPRTPWPGNLLLVTSDSIAAGVEEYIAPVARELVEVVDGDDVPSAIVLARKRVVGSPP